MLYLAGFFFFYVFVFCFFLFFSFSFCSPLCILCVVYVLLCFFNIIFLLIKKKKSRPKKYWVFLVLRHIGLIVLFSLSLLYFLLLFLILLFMGTIYIALEHHIFLFFPSSLQPPIKTFLLPIKTKKPHILSLSNNHK